MVDTKFTFLTTTNLARDDCSDCYIVWNNDHLFSENITPLSREIVDGVDESERSNLGVTHYIPVIRQDKLTTKLRVVYNASAKQDGPSLNDCLYTELKFRKNIRDIILRFQVHKVALAADIEKAFSSWYLWWRKIGRCWGSYGWWHHE